MDAGRIPPGESRFLGSTLSNRYVLRSVLGRGAFATTFLADDRILNQPVVIKLLNADDPEAIDLFRKEILATRRLQHRNIAKILAVGDEDGRRYSVTEWVEGKDLGEILKTNGPLERSRSLEVVSSLADALTYIHDEGLLHRDLKPSNVLIPGWPAAPQYRNAKILDFGVAGRLTGGLTQAGAVFGTPRYMSPEQIKGEPQTSATDIYGLGLLLFEMLTGHAPRNRTDDAMSLFRAILEEELPDKELGGLQPDVANLIQRCLRRNPAERPSIEAVTGELKRLESRDLTIMPRTDDSVSGVGAESMKPKASAALARNKWVWLMLVGMAFIASVLIFFPFPELVRSLVFFGGLLLMWASIAVGFWLRKWLGSKSSVKAQAYGLVLGAKSRVDLTATIALQLDDLVTKLRGLDERILAGTVALMLDEYGRATEAKDRQSALMNVVTLSEKLAHRLSPWYERYKEVIASGVAVLGAVSGLITALTSLLGAHK